MRRIFYKIASPFRNFYRFVFMPKTFGVKALIEHDGKLLMIRNTYGTRHWTLPGGGIKKHETPENAARRETKEEVGIDLGQLLYLGKYFSTRHYTQDTVYCFYAKAVNVNFKIDEGEIAEAKWFSISEMPQFKSAAVEEALHLYGKLNV